MKLYQPVLFVGLGGTGCDIGMRIDYAEPDLVVSYLGSA